MNMRWPDLLNRRLRAATGTHQRFSVVNAGINGNLVSDEKGGLANYGEPGYLRVGRDVFAEPHVSTLIIFEGVNDVATGQSADKIEAAYEWILSEAHQRGIRGSSPR
jgi:hypothetical protein